MSIHTSVQEKVWMVRLSNISLKERDTKKTIQACVTECVDRMPQALQHLLPLTRGTAHQRPG
eukprot:1628572-Rhodomonas_salina.1